MFTYELHDQIRFNPPGDLIITPFISCRIPIMYSSVSFPLAPQRIVRIVDLQVHPLDIT